MEVKWLLYERDQVRRQQEERVEVDRLLEYNGWIMPNHHRRFIACVEGAFLDAPRKDSCLEFGFKQEHVDRGNMPSYNVFIDGESFVAQGDDDTGECPESVRWCCGRNIVTPLAGKCKIGIPQKLLVALCVLFVPLGALSLLALVYYFCCRRKFQQQDADDEATENSASNNDSVDE